MKELRDYQKQCIKALYDYWKQPNSGNGILVLPTGSGKSLILAAIIKDICTSWPGTRVLVLSHTKELLQQDHDEILSHWPECPIGIFSAGIGRKELTSSVLVAGIQSIDKHVHKMYPPPEIVLIDEAHMVSANDCTRYKKTLKTLKQMYNNLRVVGLSATPYRMDQGFLHHGEEAIFDHIVYDVPVQSLIDMGYLAPLSVKGSSIKIDVSSVHRSGGEFIQHELEAAVMKNNITVMAVKDMIERSRDRKKWLIFACGIKHGKEIETELLKNGISCALVTGDMQKKERDEIIDIYKHGGSFEDIRALITIGVLTTGFNVPSIDMIAMMRPTESCGLYIQSVGRGMRTCPGKTDCLILDYAGNTIRHGPIDAVDPGRPPYTGEGGVPPAKECPECQGIIGASYRVCPVCGYVFPENQIYINNRPVEAPVLKAQIEPEEIIVTYTEYSLHHKEGKKESVKITYSHGLGTVSEWVFPESNTQWGDFYYRKFCKEMGMTEPYPRMADEFVSRPDLREAKRIWTIPEGKYDRVKRHEWGDVKDKYLDDVPF